MTKKTCLVCDKTYIVKFDRKNLYCSKLCRGRAINRRRGHSVLTWRFLVLKQDNFRCHYCGKSPVEDGVKLEIDHFVPKSKSGVSNINNYVAACFDCNRGKRDMLL